MNLENKIAIVTGSSRGIGEYIARGFAREGAKVVITYNSNKNLADKVGKDLGADLILQLDVSDRDSVKEAFEKTYEFYGRIDVLVNNAGINKTADFDKQTDEEWDEVLNVDLKGVFICCQEVLKYISDFGRIINIGSLSGEYGGPRTPSYAAAKAGVMALTHCLARFVAERGICVNCLSPGVIASDLTEKSMSQNVKDIVNSLVLLKRFGRYEELVGAAIFLASDESSYMTAQTLSINGGAWVR